MSPPIVYLWLYLTISGDHFNFSLLSFFLFGSDCIWFNWWHLNSNIASCSQFPLQCPSVNPYRIVIMHCLYTTLPSISSPSMTFVSIVSRALKRSYHTFVIWFPPPHPTPQWSTYVSKVKKEKKKCGMSFCCIVSISSLVLSKVLKVTVHYCSTVWDFYFIVLYLSYFFQQGHIKLLPKVTVRHL